MDSKGSLNKARIVVNTLLLDEETAEVLVKIKELSDDTYEHLLNVAYMTAQILIHRCVKERELYEITKGALLHDIGKLKIPETVLNKADYLNEEEFLVMKKHPREGLMCLYGLFTHGVSGIIKDIVSMHHEKNDGSGYPYGIRDIPWYVELVSTVDAYDAMTARRCYGMEKSYKEAIAALRYEGFKECYISDIACLGDK